MMQFKLKYAVGAVALAVAVGASAQVTLYENEGFQGRQFAVTGPVDNFANTRFNDRASSMVVSNGSWQVCSDNNYHGSCVTLRPGSYGSLSAMGLNDSISSIRPAGRDNRAFATSSGYDYRRRGDERLFQAPVTSVHAVVGPPEQRCWVEKQQVVTNQPSSDINVPGAIIGGVLGGVLGHQIGGGRGQDVATGVGAVGGAVVGANVGRNSYGGQQVVEQDVQRCASTPSRARADYWDVTYNFRGYEHHVQLTSPPGPTIPVNEQGEPRV